MSTRLSGAVVFLCPTHAHIRESYPGRCPACGMALVPEGTRFLVLRHLNGNPSPLLLFAGVIAALLAAVILTR